MSEIIIDLTNELGGAKSFRKNNTSSSESSLIHYEEFKRVEKFIDKAISRSTEVVAEQSGSTGIEDDADNDFEHNTISVSGSRGSGKTSFLLSIRDYCKRKKGNIEVPKVIDPTLIEDKGHIFLNILSLLSGLMYASLTTRDCANDPHILSDRKSWEMKLLQLAEGVPSIDGVEAVTHGWHDAQFVMKTGLSQVTAARNLRKHFNILIDTVLKELKKDALILIFDDIDVDSSKGWQLLETLRKYCTSRKLITIISGDEKLYLNLVRQQKWLGFGKEIIDSEVIHAPDGRRKWSYYNDIVTDLSGQYLQKVLPTRYRIHLNSLLQKRMDEDYGPVQIKWNDENEAVEIGELYSAIIKRSMGITNPTQGEVFITFLLSQPLRTQLQFLIAAVEPETSQSGDNRTELINTIADLFHHDMQEQHLDLGKFGQSPKYQNILSLRWLIEQDRLRDLYQLQPVTTENSENACLLTLTAMTANLIRKGNTFLIFDYFIRIAYTRNLLDSFRDGNFLPSAKTSDAPIRSKSSLQVLCEVSWLFSDTVLRDSVNQMHGFMYGQLDPPHQSGPSLFTYFIRLRGLEKTQNRGLTGVVGNRIDTVLDRKPRLTQIVGYIPASQLSFAESYINRSEICYSVHSLLATVGEIIKRQNTVHGHALKKREIERSLSSLSQLREYPIINSDSRRVRSENSGAQEDSLLESTTGEDSSEQLSAFAEKLNDWCDDGKSLLVAPHLLGKAFTRFYYSLKSIARARSNNQARLGKLFHLQIIAFLNAVLIEETLENPDLKFEKLNIEAIARSHDSFVRNLNVFTTELRIKSGEESSQREIDAAKDVLPLSRWLMKCPLLLAYLDRDNKLHSALSTFTEQEIQWIQEWSICDTLDEIDLKIQNGVAIPDDATNTDADVANQNQLDRPKNADEKRIQILKDLGFQKEFVVNSDNNNAILEKVAGEFGPDKSARSALSYLRRYLKNNPRAW